MKKAFLLVPTGILFTVSGCSGNSQRDVSKSAPAVVQASVVPASKSPVAVNLPLRSQRLRFPYRRSGKRINTPGTRKMSQTGSATPLR